MHGSKVFFVSLAMIVLLAACDDSTSNKNAQKATSEAQGAAKGSAVTASVEVPAKIGVINTTSVFKDSDGGKAGAAHLDALGKQLQTELVGLQAEAESSKSKEASDKLQMRLPEMQKRFEAEQQMVINTLNAAYQKALDSCREEEKIDIIVNEDAVLSFNPRIDLTKKIIAKMNLTPVVYTPLTPEEVGPASGMPPAGMMMPPSMPPKGMAPMQNDAATPSNADAKAASEAAPAKK